MDRWTALAGGTAVHRFSSGYSGGDVAAAFESDDRRRQRLRVRCTVGVAVVRTALMAMDLKPTATAAKGTILEILVVAAALCYYAEWSRVRTVVGVPHDPPPQLLVS